MKLQTHLVLLGGLCCAAIAGAATLTVEMKLADEKGSGAAVGSVRIVETAYGLVFEPDLKGLAAGLHGFHVHQNPSCAPGQRDGKPVAALAAGGHLDPKSTDKHAAPWEDGHLGDLPALYVAADGSAHNPVLAPRLKLDDVRNHALMVHVGGDNFSDHPSPLGGGGARYACGVIGAN